MFSPFGWHGFSDERVRVSGCSDRLPGMVQSCARERVFLPFGWHGYSAERVRASGCAYHLAGMDTVFAGMDTVLSGCP